MLADSAIIKSSAEFTLYANFLHPNVFLLSNIASGIFCISNLTISAKILANVNTVSCLLISITNLYPNSFNFLIIATLSGSASTLLFTCIITDSVDSNSILSNALLSILACFTSKIVGTPAIASSGL